MEFSASSDYPRLCVEVGLTCEACTSATATQLAQVCKGLRGKMIGQMFVQIHTHAAESYRIANSAALISQIEPATEVPAPPRRGPVPERRRVARTMAAVA
jgi:hypothetical protein